MPNYIVDASIIADFLLPGNYTSNAETLIELLDDTTTLLVPEFCLVECTNALWKRVQRREISQQDATNLADDLELLPLTLVAVKTLLLRALQIGLQHKLAIYDSVYIALAERHNLPLITADVRQAAAAQQVGVTLKPITDF